MTKPLSSLNDRLKIASVVWDIQRNDEMSGEGSGRFWQAELAPPLWVAEIGLATGYYDSLKQQAALIRSLHGMQEPFLLCDPTSRYPQADPTGAVLGARNTTVSSIGTDKQSISISGLPSGYKLTAGDKIEVRGSDRYGFLEVSAFTVQASSGGSTPSFQVFPHVPVWLQPGAACTLAKPACRVVLYPESHNPGTASRLFTEGARFRVLQKL